MEKKQPSKDEALEALDFIVNVLKEHEKDLDRLIGELGTVTEAIGDTGELSCKVDKVEKKMDGLQNEINRLVNYLSASPRRVPVLKAEEEREVTQTDLFNGPPVILRCKQWEDFKTLAFRAQTLSFTYKETDRTFRVDALKGNQIITYNGVPKIPPLLKMWLAKQLEIPENKILEGVLARG